MVMFLWERWESLLGFSTVSTGLRLGRKRGTLERRDGVGSGLVLRPPSDQTAGAVEDGEFA